MTFSFKRLYKLLIDKAILSVKYILHIMPLVRYQKAKIFKQQIFRHGLSFD